MSSWRAWLARLGVAGALAIAVGCGSGDVPDPSAAGDPSAGSAPPPAPVAAEAPAAPDPAEAVEAPVAAANAPNAAPGEAPEAAPEANVADAGAEAGGDAGAPAADEGGGSPKDSATAEMLAMANKSQPPPPEENNQGGAGGAMPGMMPGMMHITQGGHNPNETMGMQAQMQAQMRNQMQMQNQPGMTGMMAGMPGANRDGGGKDKAPNYHDPRKTVQAFLDALKDKDLERLSEATALHAEVEASVKNRNMFKRIYDGSLSEAEFDHLADALDGFKVTTMNNPRSTGRIQVVISKMDKQRNARVTRHITVRHEKKGWGVCDISSEVVFKNPRMLRKKQSTFGGSNR